jgi:Na+/H+-dicarboxylate symporter
MERRLTLYILIGMILGVIVGYAVRVTVPADSEAFTYWLRSFTLLSTIFLNLIKRSRSRPTACSCS